MNRRITRFSVHRTSVTFALFYGVLGLIFWPAVLVSDQRQRWFLLVLPMFFAVAGYLMIAAYCLLYNLVARWTGGIEFRVEETSQ